MEAGRSLRELFAELSRPGGGDPADLLRAAGFGEVPDSLVAEAIVNYAATAPLEVAEHLAPFAVAHGPLPPADPDAAGAEHGLSLLASAPAVDPAPHRDPLDHAADHVGYLDVDPSVLDDPTPDAAKQAPHSDVDPAGIDGLDHVGPHVGSGPEPHPVLGSFGVGHHGDVPVGTDGPVDQETHDGGADHDVDSLLVRDHDQDVDGTHLGVSDHDPHAAAADGTIPPLDHDEGPDPADLLDGDEHHHS